MSDNKDKNTITPAKRQEETRNPARTRQDRQK